MLPLVWNNLGDIARHDGDWGRAAQALRGCLRLCRRVGDHKTLIDALWNLAELYHTTGEHGLAVPLLVVSTRLWVERYAPLNAEEQALHDRILEAARAALKETDFQIRLHRGRALTLPEAISLALGEANAAE